MSQTADLAFGTQSELNNLEILQLFLEKKLERKGGYSVFDFEDPSKTVFVELKSRRIRHDTFDTAIIGFNKVAFADQMCSDTKLWFAFCYTDGLYVIEYNSEQFAEYEVRENYIRGPRNDTTNKPSKVVMIPIKDLTHIEMVEEWVEEEVKEEKKDE